MKKMYFFGRVSALVVMLMMCMAMFADKPDLNDDVHSWRKADSFTEDTVRIVDTVRMGEQFVFNDRYPSLPATFQYSQVPPAVEGNTIVELESQSSWNEDMQFDEVAMTYGYCQFGSFYSMVQEAPMEAQITLYHLDTIQEVTRGTVYTKLTTYELTFVMKQTLTQPGLKGDTYPNPNAVRDLTIAVGEDMENPYTFFYVEDANYNFSDGFEVKWSDAGVNDVVSSNPDVVYVQPTRLLSAWSEGEAIITVKMNEAYNHAYDADSIQYKVTVKRFLYSGRCGATPEEQGYYVMWGMDANHILSVWIDPATPAEYIYSRYALMPDYNYDTSSSPDGSGINPAPWYDYASQIQSLNLVGVQNIGQQAFYGLTNLRFVRIPSALQSTGYAPFLGCTNLTTIEFENPYPADMNADILILGMNEDYEWTDNIHIIVVPDSTALEMYEEMLMGSTEPPKPLIFKVKGEDSGVTVDVERDMTSGKVKMTISQTIEDGTPFILADRQEGETLPFDEMADKVEDLELVGASYIGANVFSNMSNLKTIKFTQHGSSSLDQIHVNAFSDAIDPWMFSMGDPQDGPLVPPTIVLPEGMTEHEAILQWRSLFAQQTMLYVPDAMVEEYGQMVSSLKKYQDDSFWSNVFDFMTDRTVDQVESGSRGMIFRWYPLENAQAYRLTIHKEGCDDCDTTIIIPAYGRKGLVDWEKIDEDQLIPVNGADRHRAPKSDDGSGGMTITLKMGSGMSHTNEVELSATNLSSGAAYSFIREVIKENNEVDASLTKINSFVTAAGDGIEEVKSVDRVDISDPGTKIYDVLGHSVRMAAEALPNGVYILENGGKRTTILLNR